MSRNYFKIALANFFKHKTYSVINLAGLGIAITCCLHQWLQDFAYRVNIGWWLFGLAGAATLLIALLTVSFHSVRAALANPVKSLRTE